MYILVEGSITIVETLFLPIDLFALDFQFWCTQKSGVILCPDGTQATEAKEAILQPEGVASLGRGDGWYLE